MFLVLAIADLAFCLILAAVGFRSVGREGVSEARIQQIGPSIAQKEDEVGRLRKTRPASATASVGGDQLKQAESELADLKSRRDAELRASAGAHDMVRTAFTGAGIAGLLGVLFLVLYFVAPTARE